MADRKQFLGDVPVDPEIEKLLENAGPVTEEQLREQRISFAFGNSPDSEFITKESVRRASQSILLIP